MFASLRKLAFAVALTFIATTGMTLASGVVAPAPAEAGILSSIKKVAKPIGKNLYQTGKIIAQPFAPVAKFLGPGAKVLFGPAYKTAKKIILHRG